MDTNTDRILRSTRSVLECGGRAQRRHRFRADDDREFKEVIRARESGVALRFPPQSKTLSAGFAPSVFIRVHPWLITVLVLLGFAFSTPAAEPDYKQVPITAGTNFIRVRLPLTDVTGKVRVKEKSADGFGIPIAPSKTVLGAKHYLEWQIGYDTPDAQDISVVPQIKFTRKGETKYGHELSKIIFEAVRLELISTNKLVRELELLKKNSTGTFEESRTVEVEVSTNITADGFQSAVQKLPQFTKTTAHGSVQIQLKQKQRAVGYQAMIYVCLPMSAVLTMDGAPRQPGPAKSKETIFYDFNRENAAFLMDIVHAFAIASAQHNEDVQKILGKILEAAVKP